MIQFSYEHRTVPNAFNELRKSVEEVNNMLNKLSEKDKKKEKQKKYKNFKIPIDIFWGI